MKGCCFIKFRDDAIFPLFFPSISFLPLFRNAIVPPFIPGISYIAELSEKKKTQQQQKRNRSLIKNRRGGRWSLRTSFLREFSSYFFILFYQTNTLLRMKLRHPLKHKCFNRVGPGSEQKGKKWNMSASLSHSSVMTDKKAAVNL